MGHPSYFVTFFRLTFEVQVNFTMVIERKFQIDQNPYQNILRTFFDLPYRSKHIYNMYDMVYIRRHVFHP